MKYQTNGLVFTTVFTGSLVYISAMVFDTVVLPLIYIISVACCVGIVSTFAEDDQNVNSTQNIVK